MTGPPPEGDAVDSGFMDAYGEEEPTELELEQDRAGIDPADKVDVFNRLEESTWLGGLDGAGGTAEPARSEDETIPDPDAEQAAERRRAVTGRPEVRFRPSELHPRGDDKDDAS
jgi:hypothetical protein